MNIEIINKVQHKALSKQLIISSLIFFEKKLIEKKKASPHSLNKKLLIAFISSAEMKKLNKYHLKKDRPTDVLSFSAIEKHSLGELLLCIEKIISQAKEHNLSFQEELIYVILHGLLHLLGYQHEKGGKEAKKMYQIQDSLFQTWQEEFI